MLAFNMEMREVIFLKDYWMVDEDGMEKEGKIYALLESKGVPNVAPFGKGNELEDDQESCLHVLTWMALRFTNHTISGGGTSKFLRAFDEEFEDEGGAKGGDLKNGFLLGRDIPCVVKFDRRPLDVLIRELTEAFVAHYKEPPSARDLQALEEALAVNLPPSIMARLTAFKYQQRLDNLAAPSWLVDTFHHHLYVDPWLPSDKFQGQPIGSGSSKKRAREQGKLDVQILGTKSQRRSDGSGLCSRS